MLRIRRYIAEDRQAVWDLHVEALRALGAYAGDGPWNNDLRRIEEAYLVGGEFLVGILDEHIVAMGAIRRTSAERAEVKRMRVHPGQQRRGFGREILLARARRARELGYRVLHLDTTTLQTAAQKFYEAHGYKRVGEGKFGKFNLILYEKNLTEATPGSA